MTLEVLVTLIAQIVQLVLPKLGVSDAATQIVNTIITTLEKIMPDLIAAGGQLVTTTQNVIAALKGTDGVTPEQWAALDAFEKQIDAEFEQAAADEGIPPEDQTPPTTPPTTPPATP